MKRKWMFWTNKSLINLSLWWVSEGAYAIGTWIVSEYLFDLHPFKISCGETESENMFMICFHNNDFVLITEWPGIWTLQTHVYTVVLWHRCIQCMHVKSLTTCDLGAFIGYDMSTQVKLWTWETKAIPMARPTAISRESKKKSLNLYNLPSWRPLDLLWEYRIQHGANGPLYVTSNYSTWIFCRGFQALQLIVLAAFGVVD